MDGTPATHYAKSGDVSIAYQTFGTGPDLVYVSGFVSNIELMWEEPRLASFLRKLGSFARVTTFDKRGTGLSDRVATLPTIEVRMDDVRAVMDAAGVARAAVFGHSEGGAMSLVFAATYPQRTTHLITYGVYAKRIRSDDYPWAPTYEERMALATDAERSWGGALTQEDVASVAPAVADDAAFRDWLSRYRRNAASPHAVADLYRMNSMVDVRPVLGLIRVPTLVIHAVDDTDSRVEEGRYIASRIPGARLLELASGDHLFWVSHQDEILGAVEEFVTGERHVVDADRVLATVLFTDIVDSTRRASELGDRRWRELVEAHHTRVRAELARHRGHEWDTAGDGFYATFDGPARAVRCGLAIRDAVRGLGLEVRAGVHTGECEMIAGKLGGIATVIGARVREQAGAGEVLATSTVRDLVAGSGLRFEDRGARVLKGIAEPWRLFLVSA